MEYRPRTMLPVPGWVYVLTCPDYPGCCKIGGTSRTATHRKRELAGAYGTSRPFEFVDQIPVSDWFAVEQGTHRMLSDRRLPRSELFQVTPKEAARVIRVVAAAHARPWAVSVWLRRLTMPPASRGRYGLSWRRRGTNWLPLLLVVSSVLVAVVTVRPVPPAWLPLSIAHTLYLVERLR